MLKKLRGVLLTGVLLTLLTGTATAMSALEKCVWVTENGKTTVYQTSADTVGDFLNEQVYIITENDKVNLPMDYTLAPANTTNIEIIRGINVEVYVDGVKEVVGLPPGAQLGTLVRKVESTHGVQVAYDGKLSEPLANKQVVRFTTIVEEESITIEAVPYDTHFELDDTLDKGQIELVRRGVEGQKQITSRLTKLHGETLSNKIVSETIIREPITRILKQGTKEPEKVVEPPATDALELGHKFTLNASAYHAGPESTGKSPGDPGYGITASGMKAQRGVVAVDPKIIPLGTRLYVDGYGYAVAGDTGGRIVGHTIDLFFEDINECLTFGRRDVTVYVLDD